MFLSGSGLRERMIDAELRHLQASRGPGAAKESLPVSRVFAELFRSQ